MSGGGRVRREEQQLASDSIVLSEPPARPRSGWAEASEALAEGGGDALVRPEFGAIDKQRPVKRLGVLAPDAMAAALRALRAIFHD